MTTAGEGQNEFEASASSFGDYVLENSIAHGDGSFSDDSTLCDMIGASDHASDSAYDLDALEESASEGIVGNLFISVRPVTRKASRRSRHHLFKKVRFSSAAIRYYEELPDGRARILQHKIFVLPELPPLVRLSPQHPSPLSEERWNAAAKSNELQSPQRTEKHLCDNLQIVQCSLHAEKS